MSHGESGIKKGYVLYGQRQALVYLGILVVHSFANQSRFFISTLICQLSASQKGCRELMQGFLNYYYSLILGLLNHLGMQQRLGNTLLDD